MFEKHRFFQRGREAMSGWRRLLSCGLRCRICSLANRGLYAGLDLVTLVLDMGGEVSRWIVRDHASSSAGLSHISYTCHVMLAKNVHFVVTNLTSLSSKGTRRMWKVQSRHDACWNSMWLSSLASDFLGRYACHPTFTIFSDDAGCFATQHPKDVCVCWDARKVIVKVMCKGHAIGHRGCKTFLGVTSVQTSLVAAQMMTSNPYVPMS